MESLTKTANPLRELRTPEALLAWIKENQESGDMFLRLEALYLILSKTENLSAIHDEIENELKLYFSDLQQIEDAKMLNVLATRIIETLFLLDVEDIAPYIRSMKAMNRANSPIPVLEFDSYDSLADNLESYISGIEDDDAEAFFKFGLALGLMAALKIRPEQQDNYERLSKVLSEWFKQVLMEGEVQILIHVLECNLSPTILQVIKDMVSNLGLTYQYKLEDILKLTSDEGHKHIVKLELSKNPESYFGFQNVISRQVSFDKISLTRKQIQTISEVVVPLNFRQEDESRLASFFEALLDKNFKGLDIVNIKFLGSIIDLLLAVLERVKENKGEEIKISEQTVAAYQAVLKSLLLGLNNNSSATNLYQEPIQDLAEVTKMLSELSENSVLLESLTEYCFVEDEALMMGLIKADRLEERGVLSEDMTAERIMVAAYSNKLASLANIPPAEIIQFLKAYPKISGLVHARLYRLLSRKTERRLADSQKINFMQMFFNLITEEPRSWQQSRLYAISELLNLMHNRDFVVFTREEQLTALASLRSLKRSTEDKEIQARIQEVIKAIGFYIRGISAVQSGLQEIVELLQQLQHIDFSMPSSASLPSLVQNLLILLVLLLASNSFYAGFVALGDATMHRDLRLLPPSFVDHFDDVPEAVFVIADEALMMLRTVGSEYIVAYGGSIEGLADLIGIDENTIANRTRLPYTINADGYKILDKTHPIMVGNIELTYTQSLWFGEQYEYYKDGQRYTVVLLPFYVNDGEYLGATIQELHQINDMTGLNDLNIGEYYDLNGTIIHVKADDNPNHKPEVRIVPDQSNLSIDEVLEILSNISFSLESQMAYAGLNSGFGRVVVSDWELADGLRNRIQVDEVVYFKVSAEGYLEVVLPTDQNQSLLFPSDRGMYPGVVAEITGLVTDHSSIESTNYTFSSHVAVTLLSEADWQSLRETDAIGSISFSYYSPSVDWGASPAPIWSPTYLAQIRALVEAGKDVRIDAYRVASDSVFIEFGVVTDPSDLLPGNVFIGSDVMVFRTSEHIYVYGNSLASEQQEDGTVNYTNSITGEIIFSTSTLP